MKIMKPINWKLCFIADSATAGNRNLIPLINEAVQAGVTIIQLRGKKLKTHTFLKTAIESSHLLASRNIPLIINDRIDIALASNADGVHLGQEDMPLFYARKILGEEKLIGISVNTEEEAMKAEAGGADYLGVGPIFFTPSKENLRPILGIAGLKAIREKVKIPILAIGGIKAKNAQEVMASGADGIAVISAILGTKNIRKATEKLLNSICGKNQ